MTGCPISKVGSARCFTGYQEVSRSQYSLRKEVGLVKSKFDKVGRSPPGDLSETLATQSTETRVYSRQKALVLSASFCCVVVTLFLFVCRQLVGGFERVLSEASLFPKTPPKNQEHRTLWLLPFINLHPSTRASLTATFFFCTYI